MSDTAPQIIDTTTSTSSPNTPSIVPATVVAPVEASTTAPSEAAPAAIVDSSTPAVDPLASIIPAIIPPVVPPADLPAGQSWISYVVTKTADQDIYEGISADGTGFHVSVPKGTDPRTVLGLNGPAPILTTLSSLAFLQRFTQAEQVALMTANPLWAVFIAAAGTIDVSDPTLLADLALAVQGGALTASRQAQVINLAVASP